MRTRLRSTPNNKRRSGLSPTRDGRSDSGGSGGPRSQFPSQLDRKQAQGLKNQF